MYHGCSDSSYKQILNGDSVPPEQNYIGLHGKLGPDIEAVEDWVEPAEAAEAPLPIHDNMSADFEDPLEEAIGDHLRTADCAASDDDIAAGGFVELTSFLFLWKPLARVLPSPMNTLILNNVFLNGKCILSHWTMIANAITETKQQKGSLRVVWLCRKCISSQRPLPSQTEHMRQRARCKHVVGLKA